MRRFWAAGLLALAAFSATALAQSGDDPPPLDYRQRPTLEDVDENYPGEAYNQRLEGQALLCCLIRENGTLQCAVVAESPAGYGFGEAARRVSQGIRLTEQSAEIWRARGPLRVPINFRQPRFTPAPPYDTPPRCGTRTSPDEDNDPVVSARGF